MKKERVKLVKKRVLYLAGLVLLLGVGLVFIYTKSNNDVVENSINISPDVKPVSEVSESSLKDLQDAEKNSTHLEFEDVIPYCPNISTVSDIHYSAGQNYNGITNEKDMLEQQYAFLERMFNRKITEFNTDCFESDYYGLIEKGKYTSFEEFMSDDEENKKRQPGFLAYVDQDEESIEAFSVQKDFAQLFLIKGKCYELSYEKRMNEKDGHTTLTQPRFVCEKVAEYYVYENNSRLEERWKLSDGEISVGEGIQFAETYINNMVQLDGENKDVELKIAYVEVYQIDENLYCFRYKIRRSIGGILCSSKDDGGNIGAIELNYDIADAYQIEMEEIDIYNGLTKVFSYEKENESEKILPLNKAIEILEKNIGNNSKYTVKSVELGYLSVVDDPMTQTEGHATVCWYFKCINEQDQWITEFYVNALTGEIKTYVRYE